MIRTIWVFILAFIVDRASKIWALEWLAKQPGGQFALWPNVLHLRYVENRGISFSLLAGNPWLLAVLSLAAMVLVVIALRAALNKGEGENMLLWLLLAGGVGNMVDRLLYGYVIDFFEIRLFRFAIFNVADVCLTIAGVILIFYLLGAPRTRQREEDDDDDFSYASGEGGDMLIAESANDAALALDTTDAHTEPIVAEVVHHDAQALADEPVEELADDVEQVNADVTADVDEVREQAEKASVAVVTDAPVVQPDSMQPVHHVVRKTKLVIGEDEPVAEAAPEAVETEVVATEEAKQVVAETEPVIAEAQEVAVEAEQAVAEAQETVAPQPTEAAQTVVESPVEPKRVEKAAPKKPASKTKKSTKSRPVAAPVVTQVAQAVAAAPVDETVADVEALLKGVIAEADPVEQIVKRIVSTVEPHVSSVQETASRIVQEVKAAAVAPEQAQEIIQRVIEAMRPRIIAAQNAANAEVKSVASQLAPGTQAAADGKKIVESAKLAPAKVSAKKRVSSAARKSGGSVRKATRKVTALEEPMEDAPVVVTGDTIAIAADTWAFPRRW